MAFFLLSTLSASICQSLPHFSASRIPALIKARTAPSVDRGKKKALQEVVDVQRKGAYVPPGGVGAEAAGGDVPASKLVLQFVFSRCGFRLFLKTRAPFRMHLWESIESLHG